MNTAIAYTGTRRHNAGMQEPQIIVKEGMRYTIALYTGENVQKTPKQFLNIIASSIGMHPDCFKIKGRARDIVELRFLAALLLRRYFPDIRLKQIAALFGGQDHTSVMNALKRANDLLYINDLAFTTKYNNTIKTINQWIKEQ
jgi:chromosomal replication initiation ATPase DnaA